MSLAWHHAGFQCIYSLRFGQAFDLVSHTLSNQFIPINSTGSFQLETEEFNSVRLQMAPQEFNLVWFPVRLPKWMWIHSFQMKHVRSNSVTEGFSQGFFLLVLLLLDWMGNQNKRNASGHQTDESNQSTRPPSHY